MIATQGLRLKKNVVTEEPDTFSYKEVSSLHAEAVAFLNMVM